MSWSDEGWAPYVPVAERRREAERALAKLRRTGPALAPVAITGRVIATTFWGRAWCDTLERYRDYESRLPRGRTYVRNGSVLDLQITAGLITGFVSGSELYSIRITVEATARERWRAICADCAGGIDSLVELLQGRISKAVMERLCRTEIGLFPLPSDIGFSCSCPDHASMCKHVAAVLYGVGARLDHNPELLFRLRAVDVADLVAGIDAGLPMLEKHPDKMLRVGDISALFGIDMAENSAEGPISGKPAQSKRRQATSAAPATVARSKPASPRFVPEKKQQPVKWWLSTESARPKSTQPDAGKPSGKTVARKQTIAALQNQPPKAAVSKAKPVKGRMKAAAGRSAQEWP